MLIENIMQFFIRRKRQRQSMGEYMRNGWISPWYHRVTLREKLFSREINDEP